MATVLITGGTGLIGTALTKLLLQKNYEVAILTRSLGVGHQASDIKIRYALWSPENQTIDRNALQEADYIVHLAGAGVADKRWTAKRKKEIIESRAKSSELIIKSLKEIPNKVKAVVSASAIGWYGADGPSKKKFTETDKSCNDFFCKTCRLWEESIDPVTEMNIRLVKIRAGIVLSREGGALKELMKPLRSGIAAILGSGKQVVSWVHIDDACRMFAEAIENDKLHGIYNAVAPKPVCNKDLVLALAKKMRRKFYIPVYVPSLALKLMLGEMSMEVLKSATVSAGKICSTGFQFLYPSIESALNELVNN
ncbi:MAG: TIGR01777 family oxidoreductase [Bacteroidetes bacterium]|nr:TIGR01777 family oxidoreductase [Bacteroidota bacterium]MBS1972978.1 TIGR01777 family oxidoreductase [Bacteroidota bacterium]